MLLEPPRRLPVDHLSASAVGLYLKSPVRWRRRYIDHEPEPLASSAVLGRAYGAAERDSWGRQIETGQAMSTPDVLDAFSDAWELALDQEGARVRWDDGERPGRVKDSGYRVLPVYHRLIAPTVRPIAVERGFAIALPEVEWTIDGFIDVETDDEIPDLKLRSRSKGHMPQADADSDLQGGTYLLARRAEGNPAARFAFHTSIRAARGIPVRPGDVAVTTTVRTDEQLDQLVALYYSIAAEMAWRLEYDVWTPPPPGSWWCSNAWCGYWATCEFGGKFAGAANGNHGPRPARRVSDGHVMDAVRATIRRSGTAKDTTTAERVARHLGITTRQASARLAKMPGVTSTRPTTASGTGAARVVREVSGPRVYRIHDEQTKEGVPVT